MSLTPDQTAKIKAAVKTKLVEIGAYVDDQLSDYVMIMITNKKNEKQMTEDLELFLGGIEQAESFSSWLHLLIKKTLDSTLETPSKTSSHHHHHNSSSHKKSTSSSKLNKSKVGSNSTHNASMNVSTNDSDELALGIDTNEFNDDLNDDSEKKNKDKTRRSTGARERKSSLNTPKEVTSGEKKLFESKPEAVVKSEPEVVNPFTKLVNKESEVRASRSSQSHVPNKVTVIASQLHPNRDEGTDEEEFDKNRLSSIVKVSDRKYNVPRSMQPNKNILLKAVDAANSSVSSTGSRPKSIADQKLQEIRSKRFEHTESSSMKQESSSEQSTKRLRKFETDPSERSKMSIFTKDIRKFVTDTRSVEVQNEVAMLDNEPKQTIATDSEEISQEPKFIVTLTGLEDNPFVKSLNKTPQKRTLSDLDSVDNLDDQLDYDEEIEDEYMDDENIEMDANDETEELDRQKKKLTRCTFWPMCDKGDQCQYLHPNKPCTAFPKCTFGNLCHYLHPSCRFDGFCTRPECPFTHVIKKPTLADASKADAILDGKTEVTAAPGTPAGTAPKITINKIQSSYTYNKNSMAEDQSAEMMTGGSVVESVVNTPNKFSLNNTASSFSSQIRMPRAAAPSSYYKPASNPYSYSNQYSFVNRATNPNASMNINCKYANMCQNPNCIYLHPNLPQMSQMKWTPALANATNKPSSDTSLENQSTETSKSQEVNVNLGANSMITQSS